jgi:hypothetical protein
MSLEIGLIYDLTDMKQISVFFRNPSDLDGYFTGRGINDDFIDIYFVNYKKIGNVTIFITKSGAVYLTPSHFTVRCY